MKTAQRYLLLLVFIMVWGCASAPTGPSEPGRPWISKVSCPTAVPSGDPAKIVFHYQGDQYPVYAEVTLTKISGMGSNSSRTEAVNYRFEDQFEIPLRLDRNPTTWSIEFYVVDRKGRWSNELSCQLSVQ